jgi:DNA polymerase-4
MVDSAINWLFVDLNSYFASIEQELCPELRGQPIAIVPIRIEAQTGCCIAVSYQAKAYGVKTGFSVADAKLLCPHIILVEARPRLYVEYHHHLRWRSSTTPPTNCAHRGVHAAFGHQIFPERNLKRPRPKSGSSAV